MMIRSNALVTFQEFTFLGLACNQEQSSYKETLADMQENKCEEATFLSKAQQPIGLHAACMAAGPRPHPNRGVEAGAARGVPRAQTGAWGEAFYEAHVSY